MEIKLYKKLSPSWKTTFEMKNCLNIYNPGLVSFFAFIVDTFSKYLKPWKSGKICAFRLIVPKLKLLLNWLHFLNSYCTFFRKNLQCLAIILIKYLQCKNSKLLGTGERCFGKWNSAVWKWNETNFGIKYY